MLNLIFTDNSMKKENCKPYFPSLFRFGDRNSGNMDLHEKSMTAYSHASRPAVQD